MTHSEFLRKADASPQEITPARYAFIEAAYMQRDLLFPDQDSIINHYKNTGLWGFEPCFLDRLEAAAAALDALTRFVPLESVDFLVATAVQVARRSA